MKGGIRKRSHSFPFSSAGKKRKGVREVDRIFDEFTEWVTDTLEIEDNPYLRIIAAVVGVA